MGSDVVGLVVGDFTDSGEEWDERSSCVRYCKCIKTCYIISKHSLVLTVMRLDLLWVPKQTVASNGMRDQVV